MASFLYLRKASALHGLHPVTKIIGMLLAFVAAMAFKDPVYNVAPVAMGFGLVWAAGALPNLRRTWPFLATICALSVVLWGLFYQPAPDMWGVHPSRTSLALGLAMAMRILAFLLTGLAFISCTSTEAFGYGLQRFGMPHIVSFAFTLAFRLVPTFMTTAATIVQAQRSRAADIGRGGFFRRVASYVPLIVPVLAYALRSADGLSMALEAKGLGARPDRTCYWVFRFGAADGAAIALMLAFAAASVAIRAMGYGAVVPGL
ncbi:MAG: energy-coupling factor transporter transmembrane component T family protein [Armatimonadota bacterium]